MPAFIMVGEEGSLPEMSLANALEAQIHSRTGGRLRFLRVWTVGERVSVSGAAPSYAVRQLAEQAALSLVPPGRLELEIEVVSPALWREPAHADDAPPLERERNTHWRPWRAQHTS